MKRYTNQLKMRSLLIVVAWLWVATALSVPVHINSGNPRYPFPQFLSYDYGTKHSLGNLGTRNAEGVCHAEMEQDIRDAYQIHANEFAYTGESWAGIKYIATPYKSAYDCTEGDGYGLLAAAFMADKVTFDGYWMCTHDKRRSKTKRYKDCTDNAPGYEYGPYALGDHGEGGNTAADGDVDVALALYVAWMQWGDFMRDDTGKIINDACGNPISYKKEMLEVIRGLVAKSTRFNGGSDGKDNRYNSGLIGFDGYPKGGDTWCEQTNWATINQPGGLKPEFGGPTKQHIDYNAPSYFREFYELFQTLGGQDPWEIEQFRRGEASSDWLIGQLIGKNTKSIPTAGWVDFVNGVPEFTNFNQGEDYRCSWRTVCNYMWHGNPDYSWDPLNHKVISGGNKYEYDAGVRLSAFLNDPFRWADPTACMVYGDPKIPYSGPSTIEWQYDPMTGASTDKNHFMVINWQNGTGTYSAVSAQDYELMGLLWRQCVIEWDNNGRVAGTTDCYLGTKPVYMHGWARHMGMMVVSGNYPAPSQMKPLANLKIYRAIKDSITFAYTGDQLTYLLDYRNFGTLDATGSKIIENVPTDFVFVSATNGGVYDPASHTVTWNLGTIPGFKTGGLAATKGQVSYVVKIGNNAAGRYCTTASISCTNGKGWVTNEYPNYITSTMQRNCIDVIGRALQIEKTVNNDKVNTDNLATFSINFENSAKVGWLDGGRPRVNVSFANGKDGARLQLKLRLFNDAVEPYINYGNYRISYYMYDAGLNCYQDNTSCPTGWALQNEIYEPSGMGTQTKITHENIVEGSDAFGKWNQRLCVQFAPLFVTTTMHSARFFGGANCRVHKGGASPFRGVWALYPSNNSLVDWSDDWSWGATYDDVKDGLFYPVTPSWQKLDATGKSIQEPIKKWLTCGCTESSKTVPNILVEEFDGYVWRRILGTGPMPGRDILNVVIIDTLPKGLTFNAFTGSIPLADLGATLTTSKTTDGRDIITWKIPKLQVKQKGSITYTAKAKFPSGKTCETADETIINKAWIYGDKESAIGDTASLTVTCAQLPKKIIPTTLKKTADKAKYQAGDNITYTIDYEQTHGSIVKDATQMPSEWTLNSNYSISGGKLVANGYSNPIPEAVFNYAYGKNGYVDYICSPGTYVTNRVMFRIGSGNTITLQIKSLNVSTMEVTCYVNSTVKLAKQTLTFNGGTPYRVRIDLYNDLLRMWINKDTTVTPIYSVSGLPVGIGKFGFMNADMTGGDNGGHTYSNIYTHFDYGYNLSFSDPVPSDITFTSATGGGTLSGGAVKWTVPSDKTKPIAPGTKYSYSWTGKVNTCNKFIQNIAYVNLMGQAVDSIAGAVTVDCGGTICTPPTKVTLTPSTTAISCGKPVKLTAAVIAPTTGTWKYKFFKKGTTSNTALNKYSTTNTIDVASSGDYLVSVVDATGDTASASCYLESTAVTVTINQKPALDTLTAKDSLWFCSGGSKLLRVTDIANATYEWTPGGLSTVPSSKYVATAAGTYTVKVTKDGCDSSLTLKVIEHKKPSVQLLTASDSLWMCSNASRNLRVTKNTSFSYQWKKGSPVSNITGEVTSDYKATAAGDYTVFVSDGNCDTSLTISLLEKKPLTYTITGGGDSCKGKKLPNVIITASDKPFSYILAGSTTPVKSLNTTDTIKLTQPGIYQISKIISEFSCETLDNSSKVTVGYVDTPTVSITPVLTGICSNDSISLTPSSDIAGGTFSWAGVAVDAKGMLRGAKATGTSTSYTLTHTTAAGCIGRFSRTIGVWATPQLSLAKDTVRECQGNAAALSASATSGQTPYTWKWLNATGLTSSTIPNPSTLTSLPKNTYTFDLELTDANACKARSKAVVVISAKEKPNFVLTPSSVCANEQAINLETMTTQAGGQFHINGKVIASGLLPKKYASTSGDTQIKIHYVSGAAACADSTEQTLTIKALPTVQFPADAPAGLCENAGKYQFGTFVPSGGTLSGTGVIAGTTKFDPSSVSSTNTAIKLQYVGTDATSKCSDTARATITVYAKPNATLNMPSRFCWDAAAQTIDAQPTGGVFDVASYINGVNFDPSKVTQSASGEKVSISYTVANANKCADTATAQTTVYFTPTPKVRDTAAVAQGLITVPPITVIGDSLQLIEKGTKIKTYADLWTGSYANQSYKTAGTYPYQATQTKNGCESKPTTVTLTISDCGLPPQVDKLQSCVNESIKTFTPTLQGTNVTAKWYSDLAMTQPLATAASFTPTATQLSKGKETTFYVTMFDQTNNCQSTPVAVTYQYDTLPSVTLALPTTICAYQAIELKAKESGVIFKVGSQELTSFKASSYTTSPHTIAYELTNKVTNCTNSGTFKIAISARQKPIISFAKTDSACANYQSLELSANIPNGSWLAPAAYLSGNKYLVGKVPASESKQTVQYVVKNSDNCYDTATRSFEIYRVSKMSVQIDSIGGLWCSNAKNQIKFTGQPSGGKYYENGTIVSAGFASSFTVGKHTIDYIVTENHCTDTTSGSFEIFAAPQAVITGLPDEICAQTDYVLPSIGGQLVGTWSGTNVTPNGIGYTLSPQGNESSFRPLLQVKDVHGCTDTISKRVTSKKPKAPQFNNPTVVLGEKSATIKVTDSLTNQGTVKWIKSSTTGNTYTATGLSVAKEYLYPAQRAIMLNGESCESEIVDAKVTVIDCPSLKPDAIETSHLCKTDAPKPISVMRNTNSGIETNNYYVIYDGNGKRLSRVSFAGVMADITPDTTWLTNKIGANYLYIVDSSESKHCVSQKQTMIVTYHKNPTITTDLTQALCVNQGKITQLQASIAGGAWSSIATNGIINPAQLGKGTFDVTYTVTDGVSCSVSAKVWIDEVDMPVIDETQKKRCVGQTLEFTTKDNSECWWEVSGKNAVKQRLMPLLTTTAGTGTLKVYNASNQANSTCASNKLTLTYSIVANPLKPIINPEKSCVGEATKKLKISNRESDVTYDWYEKTTLVNTGTEYSPFINQSTDYTVYAKRDECVSDPATASYTVVPLPATPRILSDSKKHCFGDMPQLIASAPVYWFVKNTKKTYTMTSTYTPTEEGDVTIGISENGCWSDGLNTVNYSAHEQIKPVSISVGEFCESDSKWRPAYSELSDDVEFTYNNVQIDTADIFKEIHKAPNFYKFDVVKTVNGCSQPSTIEILNRQSPKPHIDGATEICEDADITFRIANFDTTSTYVWLKGKNEDYENVIDGRIEAIRHNFIDPGVYTIRLSETDVHGCASIDSLKLRVIPKLQANFSWDIPSESLVQFRNLSKQRQIDDLPITNSFEWDFGRGYEPVKDSVFVRKFEYGLHDVTLRAGNAACGSTAFTARLFVDISTNVSVPNVFEPESSSELINCFTPVGINLEHYEIWIYDSWGNVLWYSNKLKDGSPAECWDGTYNGQILKSDTYIWRVDARFKGDRRWAGASKKRGETGSEPVYGNVLLLRKK